METTLNQILKHNPCGQNPSDKEGWMKLLNYLGKTEPDNEPLPILTILESNGFEDALWALKVVEGYDREIRLFLCWCACQLLSDFEHYYPRNTNIRYCIETSALYAEGLEGAVARDAAKNAAWDAARDVARDVARAAARAAAWTAAWDAAWTVRAAVWEIDKTIRIEEFIKLCQEGKDYMKLTI